MSSIRFAANATEFLTDGAVRHRVHSSARNALAIFGVLSPDPWRDITTLVFASHYLPAATAAGELHFRYLAFAHESAPPSNITSCAAGVALLGGLKWRVIEFDRHKQYTDGNQCVLKILLWFAHALRTPAYASLPFVGYADRDTWLDPTRAALFLRRAAALVGSRPAYGGCFEHALDYNASTGTHTGYSLGPPNWPDAVRRRKRSSNLRDLTLGSMPAPMKAAATAALQPADGDGRTFESRFHRTQSTRSPLPLEASPS